MPNSRGDGTTHLLQNSICSTVYTTVQSECPYQRTHDARTHTHTNTNTQTHKHTNTKTHKHTRTHAHTHTCGIPHSTVQTVSVHLEHCYQSCLQVLQRKLQRKPGTRTHARTHAHTRTHARTYTHARTHAHTHARTHTHARARTHAHTHTHTNVTFQDFLSGVLDLLRALCQGATNLILDVPQRTVDRDRWIGGQSNIIQSVAREGE